MIKRKHSCSPDHKRSDRICAFSFRFRCILWPSLHVISNEWLRKLRKLWRCTGGPHFQTSKCSSPCCASSAERTAPSPISHVPWHFGPTNVVGQCHTHGQGMGWLSIAETHSPPTLQETLGQYKGTVLQHTSEYSPLCTHIWLTALSPSLCRQRTHIHPQAPRLAPGIDPSPATTTGDENPAETSAEMAGGFTLPHRSCWPSGDPGPVWPLTHSSSCSIPLVGVSPWLWAWAKMDCAAHLPPVAATCNWHGSCPLFSSPQSRQVLQLYMGMYEGSGKFQVQGGY